VAVFVCALLSKSMVVNLPVVLVILDVYPLRRLKGFVAASVIAVMAQLSFHAALSVAQLSMPGRLAVSA